jgi:cytochrome oxidase Cu insertion factor (SCO1/SenC/PrrC family)
MRTPAQTLEPAVRDPRKLRRTALILTAIMIASAIGILYAYFQLAARQAEDDTPSFKGRIEKNFKLWRQDESEGDLAAMDGEVYLIVPVLFSEPERWKHTRGVLERVAKRYADRKDLHIVCLTIDPENEPPTKLKGYAEQLGATLPQWWLGAARQESIHKFLKNILKMQTIPHKKDGKWDYDGSVVLIDRDRHIRQATLKQGKYSRRDVIFDFEQAAVWDAEGRTQGLEKSNLETLEDLLVKTIDQLLAKPVTKP